MWHFLALFRAVLVPNTISVSDAMYDSYHIWSPHIKQAGSGYIMCLGAYERGFCSGWFRVHGLIHDCSISIALAKGGGGTGIKYVQNKRYLLIPLGLWSSRNDQYDWPCRTMEWTCCWRVGASLPTCLSIIYMFSYSSICLPKFYATVDTSGHILTTMTSRCRPCHIQKHSLETKPSINRS